MSSSAWAQDEAADALPVVTVSESTGETSATAPVIGYRARHAVTATKSDTPVSETPQSITVVTQEAMRDQGATNLQEALAYGAGVRPEGYGVDSRSDNLFMRGTDVSDIYVDGLRDGYGWYTSRIRPDPYTLERVELLRGPAGMLFGAGSVAGVANMVRKRPQKEVQREIGIQLGSHQRRQLQADLTGPLNANGDLLYRMIAVIRKSNTQVDHVRDDRWLLAPSITWQPDARTSVTVQGVLQKDRSGSTAQFLPWSGTLLPNPNGQIPLNRFIGEPGDYYNTDRKSLAVLWRHAFNDAWSWHGAARTSHNRHEAHYHYANPFGSATARPGTFDDDPVRHSRIGRYLWSEGMRTRGTMLDTHIQGRFDTGRVTHRLTAGIDLAHQNESKANGQGTSTIDVYAPVYGQATPVTRQPRPDSKLRAAGIYVQDQMRWGHWIAVLGARYDKTRIAVTGKPTRSDSAWTKRAGLMYQMPSGFTPYFSYAESFSPQAPQLDQMLKPLRGKQWELGLKYAATDGSWGMDAALYDLRQTNLVHKPSPTVITQLGKTHTRGVELSAQGRITPKVDVMAAYTMTNIDQARTSGPRHQASAWGRYRFSINGLSGFALGAGVRATSAFRDTSNGRQGPHVPGTVLADAMLSWESARWRLALNATNLTNKRYMSLCSAGGECWPGAGRSILLSASHRF